jgi:hypothetical protein
LKKQADSFLVATHPRRSSTFSKYHNTVWG